MKIKKLCITAVFICAAACLSALETILPPIVPIAGIRVGLGNIITLFVLYIGGSWHVSDAYIIAVLRCFLAALITGSLLSAAYGLVGGVFACTAMTVMRGILPRKKDGTRAFDPQFLPFTAVAGAIFHIAGQTLTAVLFYGSKYVLAYTPVLIASAIVGGLLTGFITFVLLGKLPKKFIENIRDL